MPENPKGEQFRDLLASNDYVAAPGVFHAQDAKIAEMTGNDAVYMSGGSTNVGLYGFFDGLVGMSEMVANARRLANATELPIIADADTGYGGVNNVQRTVREFEDAGVAALHIEDQIWPKRCGHAAGKEVVPLEDAEARYRAAVDAKQYDETVIIARVDAYGAANSDWEGHVDRSRTYLDVGVDMVWPEMPTPSREDAIRFAEEVHDTHPDANLAWNYSSNFKWTSEDDPLTFEDLSKLGYNYIFITLFGLQANAHASYRHFKDLAENDEEAQFNMERLWEDHEEFGESTNVFFDLGDFGDFQAVEERYLEDASERFASSVGYDAR